MSMSSRKCNSGRGIIQSPVFCLCISPTALLCIALRCAMTVLSVSVGCIRVALLVLPLIAVQFTSLSDEAAIAVSLVWIPDLFKGLGFDVKSHYFGAEASIYFLLIVVVKTIPYLIIEYESLEFWVPVAFVEIVFLIAVHTNYRIFFDEWRYNVEEEEKLEGEKKRADASDSTRQELDASEFAHISFLNWLLLVVTVVGFNGARIALFWYNGKGTLDSIYYDENTLLLYSMVAETVIAGLLMLRIRSMYSPYSRDYWEGCGGLIFMYVYYQLAIVWILPTWAEIGLTIGMMVTMMFVAVVIERQVTQNHLDREQFFGLVLIQWAGKLVDIMLSEEMGQIIFIALCSILAYLSREVWFETHVDYPSSIQTAACPPQQVIDGVVANYFQITTNSSYSKYFVIPNIPLSRIRIRLRSLIYAVYPYLQAGCEGSDTQVTPISTYWVAPFFVLALATAVLLAVQVIPEGRRVVNTGVFWIMVFTAVVLAFVVLQFTGDVNVSLWYLVLDGVQVNRSYTWPGILGSIVMFVMMFIALSVYRHKSHDAEIRKLLGRGEGESGSPSILAKTEKALDAVADPQYILLAGSITLLVYSILSGGPVENISILYNQDLGPPTWLQQIPKGTDSLGAAGTTLGSIFRYSLLRFEVIVLILDYIANEGLCIEYQGLKLCPFSDIIGFFGWLLSALLNAVNPVADFLVGLILKAVGVVGLQDIQDTLDKMADLVKLQGFDLFEVPSIDLPSLRFPVWLPILGATVIIIFFVTSIAVLCMSGQLAREIKVIKTSMFSLMVSGGLSILVYLFTMVYELQSQGYQVTFTWTSTVWMYALSVTIFLLSFFFAIGKDMEPQTEARELGNKSSSVGGALRISSERREDEEGEPLRQLRRPVRELSSRKRDNLLSRVLVTS